MNASGFSDKRAEEEKRERHGRPPERWRILQETMTWADAQGAPPRNSRQACVEREQRLLKHLDATLLEPAPSPQATIRLDQFLKFAGLVGTGGQAKLLIQSGKVLVNGQIERRRGKKLRHGDRVTFAGQDYTVSL